MIPRRFNAGVFTVAAMALALFGCRRAAAPPDGAVDGPEARRIAAQDYLRRVPAARVAESALGSLAAQQAPDRREEYARRLTDEMRWPAVEVVIADALARNFTAAEIRALADFNASPEGQSIQRKMGAYLAEVLPPMQREIEHARARASAGFSRLRWETRRVGFNASPEDERLTVDFPFVNESEHPVRILAVESCCTSLRAVADRVEYPPRHAGHIRMELNFGPRIGRYDYEVKVRTDDPAEPAVALGLEVVIPEVMRCEPPFARWMVGGPATPSVHRVTLHAPGMTVHRVESSSPRFRAEWEAGGTQSEGRLLVTPVDTAWRSDANILLTARSLEGRERQFRIPVAVVSERSPSQ